ncbi:MAG: flagellar motor protein, partial [Candidatus Dadabacteria bacterium]
QELGGAAEVTMDEEGVTVRVEGKLLFPSGSAELKPEAAAVLDRIAALIKKYTFDLYILGHTDSVPIHTERFPSNWELSSARATAALRYLVERGADPARLVAVGFADSRPIAPNDTPEGRARNRRVEFVFKSPEALPQGGYRPARP